MASTRKSGLISIRLINNRIRRCPAVALAVFGLCLFAAQAWCGTDICTQKISAPKIINTGISNARRDGYDTDAMYLELKGPMHWQSLKTADLEPFKVDRHLLSMVEKWKGDLIDRCVWSVYFGCEPDHETRDGGFEGCIDYPRQIWMLIDSENGAVLHTCRQRRQSDRPDPCAANDPMPAE
jgi:hypothetical protein